MSRSPGGRFDRLVRWKEYVVPITGAMMFGIGLLLGWLIWG
jgi:uncharacterized membrane protein YciS (DUF1049 family)